VLPPTLKIVAEPLSEGELTFWVIENEMPLQGEGEQSTKSGGPCPNCPHPLARWRLEKDLPSSEFPLSELPPSELPLLPDPLPLLLPPPLPELPLPASPAFEAEISSTAISSDFCLDVPLKSETVTEKLKLPLPLGVPESFPVLLLRSRPEGNWPDVTLKL